MCDPPDKLPLYQDSKAPPVLRQYAPSHSSNLMLCLHIFRAIRGPFHHNFELRSVRYVGRNIEINLRACVCNDWDLTGRNFPFGQYRGCLQACHAQNSPTALFANHSWAEKQKKIVQAEGFLTAPFRLNVIYSSIRYANFDEHSPFPTVV